MVRRTLPTSKLRKRDQVTHRTMLYFVLGIAIGFALSEIKKSTFMDTQIENVKNLAENFETRPRGGSRKESKLTNEGHQVPECLDVFSEVRNGTLEDPNFTNLTMVETALYSRFTITDPAFHVSLHSKDYDVTRWSIMDHGKYYETAITSNTAKIFRENPGGILIDVGTNIGWFSLLVLASKGEVYSFEPNPTNRVRFCESVKANRFPRDKIHLYPHAVSDRPDDLVLFHRRGSPGSAQLRRPENVPSGSIARYDVKVVRLDDVAEELGWLEEGSPSIALLKVDVEGLDTEVLIGAERLLKSRKVQNIFMEFTCTQNEDENQRKRGLGVLLASSGYTIENIGGWNGHPIGNGAVKERVLKSNGKGGKENVVENIIFYCFEENKKKKGPLQLNIWWKLLPS